MATVADYYRILQLTEGSTVAQIKAAYRKRAKQLHPDRSTSSTAHADFILLTEAYEYLSANPAATITYQQTTYQQTWHEEQRTQTRERAQTYANMQYSDFVDSDYYKEGNALFVVGHHLYLLFVIILILGVFALLIAAAGPIGVVISIAVAAITIPLLSRLVPANGPINFRLFGKSVGTLAKTGTVWVVALGILNVVAFLKIGLQTFIPLSLLWKMYLLLMLVAYGLWKFIKKPEGWVSTYFVPLFAVPFVLSLFLSLNYLFSHTPVKETYEYNSRTEYYRRGSQNSTFIYLPTDKYDAYPGIRIFADFSEMAGTSTITYTFEDGLFGLRVMKDYKFE